MKKGASCEVTFVTIKLCNFIKFLNSHKMSLLFQSKISNLIINKVDNIHKSEALKR